MPVPPVQPYDLETFRVKLDGLEGPARHAAFCTLWRSWCSGDTLQTCRQAVTTLVALCDGLTATRGHVVMLAAPNGDERPWPHWWAVDATGQVVDPTADQFPSALEYRPHDEDKGEPIGRCPNCGDGLCYGGNTMCSRACERAYLAYLNDRSNTW